jgi:hypothetical protein
MSSDVSLEVASFSELSLASDEWTVEEPFVISLYFGDFFLASLPSFVESAASPDHQLHHS